jgi:hypothetical protein
MNYTNPNDFNHQDSPEEWLNSALIFAGALGELLKGNEGVVVDITDSDADFGEDVTKVIVYKSEGMIRIIEADKGLSSGQMCWVTDPNLN